MQSFSWGLNWSILINMRLGEEIDFNLNDSFIEFNGETFKPTKEELINLLRSIQVNKQVLINPYVDLFKSKVKRLINLRLENM